MNEFLKKARLENDSALSAEPSVPDNEEEEPYMRVKVRMKDQIVMIVMKVMRVNLMMMLPRNISMPSW